MQKRWGDPPVGDASDLLGRHPEPHGWSVNVGSPLLLIQLPLDTLQVDELNEAVTLGFRNLGWKCHGTLGLPPQRTNRVTVIFLIAD